MYIFSYFEVIASICSAGHAIYIFKKKSEIHEKGFAQNPTTVVEEAPKTPCLGDCAD